MDFRLMNQFKEDLFIFIDGELKRLPPSVPVSIKGHPSQSIPIFDSERKKFSISPIVLGRPLIDVATLSYSLYPWSLTYQSTAWDISYLRVLNTLTVPVDITVNGVKLGTIKTGETQTISGKMNFRDHMLISKVGGGLLYDFILPDKFMRDLVIGVSY